MTWKYTYAKGKDVYYCTQGNRYLIAHDNVVHVYDAEDGRHLQTLQAPRRYTDATELTGSNGQGSQGR